MLSTKTFLEVLSGAAHQVDQRVSYYLPAKMSREYITAGKCVSAVMDGKSFKTYTAKVRLGTVDYAMAAETLKYLPLLRKLCDICGVSGEQLDVSDGILLVMVYELLFGAHAIKGGGVVRRRVMEHLPALQSALARELEKNNKTNPIDLLPSHVSDMGKIYKYIRVNEFKSTIEDGLQEMRKLFPQVEVDEHVPSLLILPPNTKGLGQHPGVKDSRFIIQDKASCLPSQILFEQWFRGTQGPGDRGDLIDCCAAPGNKTSHLAALVHKSSTTVSSSTSIPSSTTQSTTQSTNSKKRKREKNNPPVNLIFAFDKNPKRAILLHERMKAAGADAIVHAQRGDFLTLDPMDFPNVTAILLDPSCSGSGVVGALERVVERSGGKSGILSHPDKDHSNATLSEEVDRLESLRNFQVTALLHAMSFPNARAITYSTCSINDLENECVVAEVLKTQRSLGWSLEAPACLATWKRRGKEVEGISGEEARKLIRCLPEDGCQGFFVALFVRNNQ